MIIIICFFFFWWYFNPTWQHLITKWGKLFTWWNWKCKIESFEM